MAPQLDFLEGLLFEKASLKVLEQKLDNFLQKPDNINRTVAKVKSTVYEIKCHLEDIETLIEQELEFIELTELSEYL